jgi:PPM family protein phosphatase
MRSELWAVAQSSLSLYSPMMNQLAPIKAAMKTDRGRVRDHNEDFVQSQEPTTLEEEKSYGWVYIVADGVGGADAGEFASEFATTQTLAHYSEDTEQAHFGHRLVKSMQSANTDLRTHVAESNDGKRMATTMVAAVVTNDRAYIANVGDSRGYHWRDKTIRQITKDQSLVAKLLEEGAITEEEAISHPHRNVILFSIGSEKTPKIELFEIALAPGDKILLCSDGLTRHVNDDEISEVLEGHDLEHAATQLIQMANDRGGQDNISVAIIDFGEETGITEEQGSLVAMPQENNSGASSSLNRAFLIPFTALLSVVEAILIVLVWLLLRV